MLCMLGRSLERAIVMDEGTWGVRQRDASKGHSNMCLTVSGQSR